MLLDTPNNSHAARILFTGSAALLFSYGKPAALKVGGTVFVGAAFASVSTERHVKEFSAGCVTVPVENQQLVQFCNGEFNRAAEQFANQNER